MNVCDAVRQLRTVSGLSQQAFATRFDMSVRAIANYEKNRAPNKQALFKFARYANELKRPDLARILSAPEETTGESMHSYVKALKYAINVIESYEMDIRHGIATGVIPEGFCQGTIYRDALEDIARVLAPEPFPFPASLEIRIARSLEK